MSSNPSTRLVPADRLSAIASLVAEGAVFEGQFHSAQDQGLRIDGQLKGNVAFPNGGTLHVGPGGLVENTQIEADYVFIEGKVVGTVIARKALEIADSGVLVGEAAYDGEIDIHPRARVRARLEYRGDIDSARG